MSIFPTRILLAHDASKDAWLAAKTAVLLAMATRSELHFVNVGVVAPALLKSLDVRPARTEQEAASLGSHSRNIGRHFLLIWRFSEGRKHMPEVPHLVVGALKESGVIVTCPELVSKIESDNVSLARLPNERR